MGNSADRANLNNNIKNAVNSVSLGSGLQSFTWSKAAIIARSFGGDINDFLPKITVGGKAVGAIGVGLGAFGFATSMYSLVIGLAEDGYTWDEDGWNSVQLGLATIGLGAAFFTAPWIAVVGGIAGGA